MANAGFPVVGDGYQAEAIVSGRHLRLFAEVYTLGHVAVVYDVTSAREIARTDADNLKAAMDRAEELAANYLTHQHNARLPAIEWGLNAQTRNRQPH